MNTRTNNCCTDSYAVEVGSQNHITLYHCNGHSHDHDIAGEQPDALQRIAELEQKLTISQRREHALEQHIEWMDETLRGNADALLQAENSELKQRIADLEQHLSACQQEQAHERRLLHDERKRRVKAEHALQHSETLFRTLIESNRDPFIVVHDDTIRYVNTAAEGLLGRPARDLVGEPVGFLIADDTVEVDVPGKHGVCIADMHVIDVEWEGECVSLASLRDITSYKRLAEELQQANDLLEQRVQERTSDLLQANDALHQSEERFRTVADFTYDWEYWLGPDGKYLYVSPSCERITGYQPDAFYANPDLLLDIIHPDDQALLAHHLHNDREESQMHAIEFRIITRGGNERWIGHKCQPVYTADGRWSGRRGSNRDITDRKNSEISLRNANEMLEMLFSSLHLHIAYMDAHFNFIRVNETYAAANGRTTSFFAGKNHFDLYPNQDNEAIFRQVVETGTPYVANAYAFQYPHNLERGTTYWDWTLYPVKDKHGNVEGLILSLLDVTERVQAAEAYRAVVDHSLQGLAILQGGRVAFVNPSAASMSGYTVEELLAMSARELALMIHPDDRATLINIGQDRRKGKPVPKTVTFRIIRKDGELRSLEAFHHPITYRGRKAIQATYLDVTERKWAEEAYRTLVDHSLQGLAILQTGHVVFANPAMFDILGYNVDELLGLSSDDIYMRIHPDDREQARQYLQKRLSGQYAPARYELRMIRKDGGLRWVEVYAVRASYQGNPASQVAYVDITERKRAEQDLAHARMLLQAILDSTAEGIAVFTKDRGIMAHNNRFEKIWGLSEEWSHRHTWSERAAMMVEQVADPWTFVQRIEELSVNGEREEQDTIHLVDGRVVERHVAPYVVKGEVVGQVWSLLDVTTRVQTEHALRESEARYRALVKNFPDGVVLLFDHDMRFLVAGGSQLAMFGLTPETMEGKTLQDVVPPEVAEIGMPLYRDTLAGTAPEEVEQHYGDRVYRTQPVSLRNEEGEIVAGMIISQDITERKNIQKLLEQRVQERTAQLFTVIEELHNEIGQREWSNRELEQSRNLLRVLFDSIGDSLVLLNCGGEVLAANHSAATLLGRESSDELINQSWADLCQIPGREARESHFPAQWVLEALPDSQLQRRRETFVMPDGTTGTFDMQLLPVLPIHTSDGEISQPKVRQMVLHIANVTERLQLEKLQLENERLATIRKLSQIIAHEVNTPLQTILNALEGLQLADERYRTHFLSLAQTEIERIGAIVHRLKDPLQSPPQTLEVVDIANLLERVLILTDATLRKYHIVVKRNIAPDLPMVYARPDQLTQVFLNLILNAIEAMPEGGTLRVAGMAKTTDAASGNGHANSIGVVVVEIHDTGMGIDPDIQEHIFDSFFTTRELGTGLGLAVSQKIVTDHQGSISVQSQPGVGSVFTVTLPGFMPAT
jgi:PAS domain S-box-containing protein